MKLLNLKNGCWYNQNNEPVAYVQLDGYTNTSGEYFTSMPDLLKSEHPDSYIEAYLSATGQWKYEVYYEIL